MEEKKRRLSLGKILGKRDKDTPKHNSTDAPSTTSNVADSAYASSENEPMVSLKNTGQIEGVDSSRHLAMNQNTGDVMDEDTGEVVSTVTTTTTTTTTTTMRGKDGKKITTVATQPGQPAIQEMPAESLTPQQSASVDGTTSTSQSVSPAPQPNLSPDVPTKSPNRKSSEHPYRKSREIVNPVSPIEGSSQAHNFSRPSRDRPGGTIENLKAAAIGIHGVGETLRGTINSEVDSRFPRGDPNKAATANAKNQATLTAGEREMAGLRDQRGLQSTVAPDRDKNLPDLPHQPNYTYHPNAPPQNMTALPTMKGKNVYVPPHGTAVPQEEYYDNQDSQSYQTTEPSYDGNEPPAEDKRSGLRKLIKRRPVR